MIKEIEIQHELCLDELSSRLRNVSLRGFPDVKIYKDSLISFQSLTPSEIKSELFTPQPAVYTSFLDKISELAQLFSQKGIDIFSLSGGFDFTAVGKNSEITEWTIIPPVVEVIPVFFNKMKGLDYSPFISHACLSLMRKKGYELNPELQDLDCPEYERFKGDVHRIPEICDGSHRVEAGVRRGLEQSVIFIYNPAMGYPYYAAPKPYSCVHEEQDKDKSDKTHVLTSPGHKMLYRVFPSGGILSGTVRSAAPNEKFD